MVQDTRARRDALRHLSDDPRVTKYLKAREHQTGDAYQATVRPYIQAHAEAAGDDSVIRLRLMRSLHTAGELPLGAIAIGFRATAEEMAYVATGPEIVAESDNDVARLKALPYADYLQTKHWEKVRESAIKRADGRCQMCNASERLEVHHRTYTRLGAERNADLFVVCAGCHSRHHGTTRGAA